MFNCSISELVAFASRFSRYLPGLTVLQRSTVTDSGGSSPTILISSTSVVLRSTFSQSSIPKNPLPDTASLSFACAAIAPLFFFFFQNPTYLPYGFFFFFPKAQRFCPWEFFFLFFSKTLLAPPPLLKS